MRWLFNIVWLIIFWILLINGYIGSTYIMILVLILINSFRAKEYIVYRSEPQMRSEQTKIYRDVQEAEFEEKN